MSRTTLELSGGGRIGFARYGRPGRRKLLLHHGLLGNAELPPEWEQRAAVSEVDLVAVERPGYGLSTPAPLSSVAGWVDHVTPLLQHLGWDTFDVAGISAGAPYAYALAAKLPERVRAVWILSGVPFLGAAGVLERYPEASQHAYAFYREGPEDGVRAQMEGFLSMLPEEVQAHPILGRAVEEVKAHAFSGPTREARLQILPWGFGPEDVRQKVTLWHAREDDMVPFPAIELSAGFLPASELILQVEPEHIPSDTTETQLFERLRA
ncbi:alpha/beta hydrolase [Chondromyces crocatus]|uniref:AB hydrolase-1 domain-containing protein n=1 Tax=Chondromyces crocatus TaxID=52 RepID=A0A0K1EPL9_CHOCO|nr:alpha/beta hydrolase [Chondromyces crocatus]AKT42870.1 uncharacterized protein CMC5_070980 [Chondromyces crocatus]